MRTQFSKIVLAAFAVNSALSMAFAGIPANCAEEIITLSKSSDFDMKKFMTDLPVAVAKAKLQAKSSFGMPKDSDKTDIGITFGCLRLRAFPESPSEIASLLKDINQKTASGAVAVAQSQAQPQYMQPQAQPQYAQPQAQPQYAQLQVQPQYVQPQAQPQYAQLQVQPQYVQPQVQSQYMPPQEQPQVQYVYVPQPCPQCPRCEVQRLIGDDNKGRYKKVQRLIEDGVDKNKGEIQMESAYLSSTEIENLYEKNKKSAGSSALLGATIGLGIGSYMQGNIAMGVTQSLLDALSIILISAIPTPTTGYVFLSISRVTGLIAPIIYTDIYNDALKSALSLDNISYSIDPLIVPKDGGAPAVGLAFNLRY